MPRYAQDTSVSVEKSKGEIERTLTRYGADGFQTGWHKAQGKAMVAFEFDGRHVRFFVDVPNQSDDKFMLTETGRTRSNAQAIKAWEQEQRQRWRALNLVVKAKMEAIECEIETFEEAFLAHLVLPDGSTVAENLIPKIVQAIDGNKTPRLLLPEASRG
jgi:hypothetical protein